MDRIVPTTTPPPTAAPRPPPAPAATRVAAAGRSARPPSPRSTARAEGQVKIAEGLARLDPGLDADQIERIAQVIVLNRQLHRPAPGEVITAKPAVSGLARTLDLHADGSFVVRLRQRIGAGSSQRVKRVAIVRWTDGGPVVEAGAKLSRKVAYREAPAQAAQGHAEGSEREALEQEARAHADNQERAARLLGGQPHVVRTHLAYTTRKSRGTAPTACKRVLIEKEYPRGDLARRLRTGPLEPATRRRYIGDLLEGLVEVHQAGLMHLDVKPENVLIDQGDGGERLVLADFELSAAITASGPGELCGTPGYIPPDVLRDHPQLPRDPKDDVFALGVVLYQIHFGEPPFFLSGSPGAVLRQTVALDEDQLIEKAFAGRRPTDAVESLIFDMLQPARARRLSSREALERHRQTLRDAGRAPPAPT